jgi:hypothetical protein
MDLDNVRHFMNVEPFEPFEIRLANGDKHRIVDADNIAVGKNVVCIAYSDSNRIAWCTPRQIVNIEKIRGGRLRRNGRRTEKE